MRRAPIGWIRGRWRWLPAGTVAGVILLASVVPVPAPIEGRRVLGPLGLVGVDLWLHAVGYALLAVALASPLSEGRGPTPVVIGCVLVLSIGYGLTVELLQAAVPTRSFQSADVVANTVGASAAVIAWRLSTRLRRADPRPRSD